MNTMATPNKRRKKYLESGEPFQLPRTTYNRNSARIAECADTSQSGHGTSANEPSPSTSRNDQPTNDGVQSDQAETEGFLEETLDGEDGTVVEDEYGNPVGQGDSGDSIDVRLDHDSHASDSVSDAPVYDEAQCLADSFAEYGKSTLPHSTTTKAEAVALIMAFLTSENMPWTALDKLLHLVNTLFGAGSDVLPRSKYLFRKLWAAKTENVVRYHYYCRGCGSSIDDASESEARKVCSKCAMTFELAQAKSDGCFFITMNLHDQMRHIISQTKQVLHENLVKLREEARAPSDVIHDITSAAGYRHLQQSGLHEWTDLTITFNTDGSPLYKSSKASVWPVQFIVNELPPSERFNHCVLGGLWFGSSHPDMSLFMTKFVEEVTSLGSLSWEHNSTVLSSKVHALCCCVDAPARAEVRHHVQYNGYFGCSWCLASGEHLEGSLRYRGPTPDEERTPEGVRRDMQLALLSGASVNGVKGPSPLTDLPHFNLVWGFSVDYMHCVLLGVTRQFTEYLFSSTNCRENYYIGSPSVVATVNKRLLSTRPPHCATRLPRPVGDRSFWKASEWRQWLLFYCLPCTLGILDQRYWNHLRCLVEAVYILLLQEFTPRQLEHAGHLLQKFVARVERLYKKESCMSYNVHQLLHLQKAAEQMGPLWAHSAFVFESGNGRIVKSVTAAKGVPMQIVERVVVLQELRQVLSCIPLHEATKKLCQDMLGFKRVAKYWYTDGACMLGSPTAVGRLTSEEEAALEVAGIPLPATVLEYKRFVLDKMVYNSNQYLRTKKSDSSVILTKTGEHFKIMRILQVNTGSETQSVLLCKKIVEVEADVRLPRHINECFLSGQATLTAVDIKAVACVCIFINFVPEETTYVCDLPNVVERD